MQLPPHAMIKTPVVLSKNITGPSTSGWQLNLVTAPQLLTSSQDSGERDAPMEEDAPPPQPQRSAAPPAARPPNGNGAPRPAATRAPARNVPQTIDSDEDLPF